MKITVLSNTVDTVATAKGSYQKLELAFKGEDGQVKGKKIMSFGAAAPAFKVLAKAQSGEVYDITAVKNEASGYWDWTGATKSVAGGADSSSVVIAEVGAEKAFKNAGKNFETPEERARKQVYIVRQSSITAALAYLNSNNTKRATKFDVPEVVAVAKEFEAYVFDTGIAPVAEAFKGDEDLVL